jgi:hypothetical protein
MATALFGAGCGAAEDFEENVATANEAVTLTPAAGTPGMTAGYEWNAGAQPQFMPSTSTHVCFLTGIQGLFTSANDSIAAERVSPGVWQLSGTRGTGLPGGRSYCFASTPVTGYDTTTYNWPVGGSTAMVDMGAEANRTCFLTRVKGRFSGTPNSMVARVFQGRWVLYGGSASASDGVAGSAVCVKTAMNPLGANYTWASGSGLVSLPIGSDNFPIWSNSPNGPYFCGMTMVGGNFLTRAANMNNIIRATYETVAIGPSYGWNLRGQSGPSRFATYSCLR